MVAPAGTSLSLRDSLDWSVKLSIPGLPGVSYDTEDDAAPITAVFTAAGRRAPKPHGYALQALPVLWALDVDLREVPDDHPLQYLHPEGAHSFEELPDRHAAGLGRDIDFGLRFLAAVSDRTESNLMELLGREESIEGTVVEIEAATDPHSSGSEATDESGHEGDERAGARLAGGGHADEPTFVEDGTDSSDPTRTALDGARDGDGDDANANSDGDAGEDEADTTDADPSR